MTVTGGDDVGIVRDGFVVRVILRVAIFLDIRRVPRLRLIGSAVRIAGSPGRGVTGACGPWRSPGRARPRHPIHVSERNRCNA